MAFATAAAAGERRRPRAREMQLRSIDALGEALTLDGPPPAGETAGAPGHAASPLPEQQEQLVPLAGAAAMAVATVSEPKRRL